METKLIFKNSQDHLIVIDASVYDSSDDIIRLLLNKSDALSELYMSSEIYIGMRFIIGKLFPRPYKLIGMDEYYGTDKVSFTLEIDKIDHGDSIEKGIAFNNLHK